MGLGQCSSGQTINMLVSFITMARWFLALGLVGLYFLHQDTWFWDVARPLVFGFLPIGLFYHAVYTVAICLMMLLLIRYAWPLEIERDAEEATESKHVERSFPEDLP